MTQKLKPEEDAGSLEEIRDHDGGVATSEPYGISVRVDKSKVEMEIAREGERFLEVRFKRRESADAGKVVAVDEMVAWPTNEEIERLRASLPEEHRFRLAGLRGNAFVVRAKRMGYFKPPCDCSDCRQARATPANV